MIFSFKTDHDDYTYMVAICSDTSRPHVNDTVTRSKVKEEAVVLGRRNDTHVTGGCKKKPNFKKLCSKYFFKCLLFFSHMGNNKIWKRRFC